MKKLISFLLIIFIVSNCYAVNYYYTDKDMKSIIQSLENGKRNLDDVKYIIKEESTKRERNINIFGGAINMLLSIWGISTGTPYGMITGILFGFGSYSNFKEAVE